MGGETENIDERWMAFRGYLHSVIQRQMIEGVSIDNSDIVQQTFLEAHQQHAAGKAPKDPRRLRNWLRRILLNNLTDTLRSLRCQKRDVRKEVPILKDNLIASLSSPSSHFSRGEQSRKILAVIAGLPEVNRQVIRMRFFEGKNTQEIAEFLGRSEQAVAALLHRTVLKLKDKMAQEQLH